MPLKDRLSLTREPLYLVDGSSFLYRGYYANPDLKRSDGFPTNAMYSVLRVALRLLKDEKPHYVGFFFDGPGRNFRHEAYAQYKANRPAMPEPLAVQIEPLRRAIGLMGLPLTVTDGVEADDCIASLAAAHKGERPVVILASDKDLRQCLDKNVYLWEPSAKEDRIITREDFERDTGMRPEQWPDFQALTGDTADNIPGIAGIGPKSATQIIHDFPDIESVRDRFSDLPEKFRKKIEGRLDDLFLYRTLTRLRTDSCALGLQDLAVRPVDAHALADFLLEYEFRSLLRELPGLPQKAAPAVKPEAQNAPAPSPAKTAASPLMGSLLDFVAPAPKAAAPLEAHAVEQASALPDPAGRDVGLVRVDGRFHIGLNGGEYIYSGPEADLARRLSAARSVAVPGLQDMLRADPAWDGLPLKQWFDLSLAAYLLNPEDRNYSWERLRQALFQDAQAAEVHPEAHGLAALACRATLEPRLKSAGLDALMADLETPLMPVLVDMEREGIRIDHTAFATFLSEVSRRIDELTAQIHRQAGGPFNVRSSQQLAVVLFETLKLKPAGKTPGGALSTGSEVLERLAGQHPLVDQVLEFRMLEKLRSTYLEPLPRLAGPDGRIHTHFNQLATATGRLSSSGPNLQNIPIRGPQGKRMRACFTAGPGHLLSSADYSQIELRVLAHFSKDPTLLDAFARDQDIHSRTAALLFDKTPETVSPEERRNAKTINFGLIYGMGPQKLARELSISMNEAKAFIERYFSRLSTLKSFYDELVEQARASGFVTTLAGRRRLLPELHSRNQQLASQARRQAINTVIQGSAADIIKLAMLAAHADPELKRLCSRLILQVHDELVVETPEAFARAAGERLKAIMQGVASLAVPLKVDLGTGPDWAAAH